MAALHLLDIFAVQDGPYLLDMHTSVVCAWMFLANLFWMGWLVVFAV
jgi:hypothetical protein